MVCHCDTYQYLDWLENAAPDDTSDELHRLVTMYASDGDEYAAYLKACTVIADEVGEDSGHIWEMQLEALVRRNNPWALAELGLQKIFEKADGAEQRKGRRYLWLGAVLGEKRAQYYVAYQLISEGRCHALALRLLKASMHQGFERAVENFDRLSSSLQSDAS